MVTDMEKLKTAQALIRNAEKLLFEAGCFLMDMEEQAPDARKRTKTALSYVINARMVVGSAILKCEDAV